MSNLGFVNSWPQELPGAATSSGLVNIRQQGLPGASSRMFQRATNVTNNLTRFRPGQVQGATYGAQTVGGMNLSPYMNPYTQQVIDTSMADMQRANQMAINDVGAAATKAGAFGGSRHGLVEAATNADFARNAGAMAAQLRQQGFTNAQQMAQQDATMTNQARQFNAGNRQQARLANQDARLAGAQFRLGAANQMGNLSNLGFGMGRQITADQMNAGNQQQDLIQRLIDAGNNQYRGFTGQGNSGLATLLSALGGVPVPQSSSTTGSPGLFGLIGEVLSW